MYLRSCEDVYLIYKETLDIRDKTPHSFRMLIYNLDIFKPNTTNLKLMFYKYNLDNLIALPIFPSELFSITYENIVSCPDDKCANFQKCILENKLQIYKIENLDVKDINQEIEIIGK